MNYDDFYKEIYAVKDGVVCEIVRVYDRKMYHFMLKDFKAFYPPGAIMIDTRKRKTRKDLTSA